MKPISQVTFYTRTCQIAISHNGNESAVRDAVLPAPIAAAWTWFDGLKFIGTAIKTLWQRKLTVEVVDGVAIGASLLMKDYPTAGAVMYLLGIGDILEEWTHRKSVLNLAQSMSLNVDKVWVLVDDVEISKSVNEIVKAIKLSFVKASYPIGWRRN